MSETRSSWDATRTLGEFSLSFSWTPALPARAVKRYLSLLLSCWLLISVPALADVGTCSASATNVAFGSLSISTLTGATTTGSFSVTCPSGHGSYNPWGYCNSIGAGTNSASQSNRTMKFGSNSISYQLYTDSGYTNTYAYPGNTVYTWPYSNSTGSTAPSTVYAKILSASSGLPPGTYTDTYNSGSAALANSNGAPMTYSVAENCTVTTGVNWWNTLNFTVSVTVLAGCNVSTTVMNFGSTSSFIAANINTTATITAQCTSTTPYSIGLDNGQNASGAQRRMSVGGGNFVSYGLYTDAGYSNGWTSTTSTTGCTSGANTCVLGTGTGSNQSITLYGQVPPQTAPAVGTYSDTVVVTLTF
jgi:spore coat protein U domain-containing protein, fimbrial subunit CupE1/2/3/6